MNAAAKPALPIGCQPAANWLPTSCQLAAQGHEGPGAPPASTWGHQQHQEQWGGNRLGWHGVV